MKKTFIIVALFLLLLAGLGLFIFSNKQPNNSLLNQNIPEGNGVLVKKVESQENKIISSSNSELSKRYLEYSTENLIKATVKNEKAVLFFAALAWCPSCQAADRDIKENFGKIPQDITILKIDYDTAKDLKQKYNITMQDTFIQVDRNGKEITRWNSGGQGVKALLANVK